MRSLPAASALLAMGASFFSAQSAPAQSDIPVSEVAPAGSDLMDPSRGNAGASLKSGENKSGDEWVVAPIPGYNPSQGWSVKLIGQYIFKNKTDSPNVQPSIAAAGAFYTQEESYGFFGGYLGRIDDDRWRVAAGGGWGTLNYDFYGIGNEAAEQDQAIPIEQEMRFGLVQSLYRMFPHIYGGLRAVVATSQIAGRVNMPNRPFPPLSGEISTNSVGPVFQWDTRDNLFYPTTGHVINASVSLFDESIGSDYTFTISEISYNVYMTLPGDGRVLATRVYARYAGGDAPFFALSQFGQGSDLRGYKNGKYRDNFLITTQTEFRQRLTGRWGYVLFGGLGEVAPSATELSGDNVLWSVGAGLRFQLAKENPVNMRLDWAYGVDGGATYVSVTEAF